MPIVTMLGHSPDSVFVDLSELDPVEASRLLQAGTGGDIIDISAEALEALEEAKTQAVIGHAMSLPQISARIESVREEIATVWNSALPEKEKLNLISAKENEIALLQAGQFDFARAGFSMVA